MILLLALACADKRPDQVVYTLQAPGLSASELVDQGLFPLEAAVAGQALWLRSEARPGRATLRIGVPAMAEAPLPELDLPPGMELSLQLLREEEQRATLAVPDYASAQALVTRLQHTPCIAQAELVGGEEIWKVSVDPGKLPALDLSMAELASEINSEPLDKQVVRGVPLVDLADFERVREGPRMLLDDQPIELIELVGQGCEGFEELLAELPAERLPEGVEIPGLHPLEARRLKQSVPEGRRHLLVGSEELATFTLLGSEDKRTVIRILGPRELLQPAAEAIAPALDPLGSLYGVKPVQGRAVRVELKREAAARMGVSSSELAWTQREIPHPEGLVVLGGSWEEHTLRGSHGLVPLSAVATVELLAEPLELQRADGQALRTLKVRASREQVEAALSQVELPPGVTVELP